MDADDDRHDAPGCVSMADRVRGPHADSQLCGGRPIWPKLWTWPKLWFWLRSRKLGSTLRPRLPRRVAGLQRWRCIAPDPTPLLGGSCSLGAGCVGLAHHTIGRGGPGRSGGLPSDTGQVRLPRTLPNSGELFLVTLEERPGGSTRHGRYTWSLLRWMLLGADVDRLRPRSHEPGMDGGADRCHRGGSPRSTGRPNQPTCGGGIRGLGAGPVNHPLDVAIRIVA